MVCAMSRSDGRRLTACTASAGASGDLRAHSAVFSTGLFRTLSNSGYLPAVPHLDRLIELAPPGASLREVLEEGFEVLERQYRSEYVYKNAIVSKIIFGRHSPKTANALIEQPLGNSIADVLVVNGTTTAYEIKTDFDDFDRLDSQLTDYSQHCEHVYVVTSEKRAGRATELAGEHIGVMALRKSGALTVVRPSTGGLERLDIQGLYMMLRKYEALSVLDRTHSFVPDGNSGLQSQMWERFGTLPIEVAHAECVRALRLRGSVNAALFETSDIPRALRALIYGTPMSGAARKRMMTRLERSAGEYTLTV